ncbi:hypothetical protein G8E11_000506 [Salmonella enterica]|nr:hypothetical protein [Salmonella enterica]EEF7551229.1 hypothetical protein [Salmonella enterica subsp. diarizonae serovar 48:i:z]EEH3790511.1 hypothetical protein [Salmonella enterica subsp. enterica serovar 4,[5],12:i:-]EAY0570540.1 hypothetical protein [Salmonella enterica]EBI5285470.1 hypothetical protein [Salmonella enterica]
MINTNLTITDKAIAGVEFLRNYANLAAEHHNWLVRITAEPQAIAASAIEQLVKENTELRAQLVAFQKAANPTVAVDPASGPDTTACYTRFVRGARVCLKANPDQRGTVVDSSISSCAKHLYYVRFDSEFEDNRWVKVSLLEALHNDE